MNQSAKEALQERLRSDPHRPRYHFLPPANWMNDPNGLIQWQGQYHMFYQYNPNGPFWGTIHWGHAVSDDLVHWTHLPIALAPTPGSADADGCWSGCAVIDNGVPTLIYTGDREGKRLPCLATSADGLMTWEKYPGNPVIPAPPEDLELIGFRDHWAWKEGSTWYQLIGAGIKDVGGTVLLYRSKDLLRWEYLHPLYVGDENATEPLWTGSMWECPQLLSFGDKHVLIISVHDRTRPRFSAYFVGSYADHLFSPESVQKLDYGDLHFYAPQALIDEAGRTLLWGWIQEGRSQESQLAAGWSGVMSLPRILTLNDGVLGIKPVPELEILRTDHYRYEDLEIAPESVGLLQEKGNCLELVAEFEPGDAAEFGLIVRRSAGGEEETRVFYNASSQHLAIDRARSSLDPDTQRDAREGSLTLASGEFLKFHVFLDRSVIEVFAGGRAAITSRIYPSLADSLGLDLFATGGRAKLRSLDIWKLKSIWD